MGKHAFFEVEKDSEKRFAVVFLNRPDKRNAMSWDFWRDLPEVVNDLEQDSEIHAVVFAARGKSFSTGLDLEEFSSMFRETIQGSDADHREDLYKLILQMQEGFKRIVNGKKIYIAAVHRHCIGGALDLISACDLRLAAKDASVSLRETKVAIVADMGSLNRLPSIIGHGHTRMMAFTGRDFSAIECKEMGLFNEVYESQEALLDAAKKLAAEVAANPGIVLRGVKNNLRYMEAHSPAEGMEYVAAWNAAFLDSQDFRELMTAFKERRKPKYK